MSMRRISLEMRHTARFLQLCVFWATLVVGSALGTGCATWGSGQRIEKIEKPLTDIQRSVIAVLPAGRRETLAAGREFLSGYFVWKSGKPVVWTEGAAASRMYAHFYILGDRRPYVVEIHVVVENRDGAMFVRQRDENDQVAAFLKTAFEQELSKRREDINIIDDFRVF